MTEQSARALLRRFGQSADRFATCFNRRSQRTAATQYLDAPFNDSARKSVQAMHGRLSDPGSYEALQHLITDSPWEAEPLWQQLRTVVPLRTGILALDDTSFPKQGRHSVGVQRQYCGALGRIANCQVAVSTVLLGERLAWPLTFELHLPAEWCEDAARRLKARVPDPVRFRKDWRIALAHVRRVLQVGFQLTAVVADAEYGSNAAFRRALERLGLCPPAPGAPGPSRSGRSRAHRADGVRFNTRFLDLAGHYGFTPRACRPALARTKGKDERMVGYVKHHFFVRYRAFDSWAHLNQLAEQWLRQEADARVHGTAHEVVRNRFAREVPRLQP